MGWVPVAAAVFQGVQAVRGYMQERQAAKETKRSNAAMMAAAQEEARLNSEDAAKKALSEKQAAARVRAQQVALFLKSGVTLDGSPMLVTDETTTRGDENAKNVIETAESQNRSMLLRARANQQPVKRADFFGMTADVLGSANKAKTAGQEAGYWK